MFGRVIENRICALVSKGLDGDEFDKQLSKRDRVVSSQGIVKVFLWNTQICTFWKESGNMLVETGGYRTNTTKSRLNTLLYNFAVDKPAIFQKNWVWRVATRCPLTNTWNQKDFGTSLTRPFVIR